MAGTTARGARSHVRCRAASGGYRRGLDRMARTIHRPAAAGRCGRPYRDRDGGNGGSGALGRSVRPERNQLPGDSKPPSGEFLIGTDAFGRDVFSRLLWGARTALVVGFVSSSWAVPRGAPGRDQRLLRRQDRSHPSAGRGHPAFLPADHPGARGHGGSRPGTLERDRGHHHPGCSESGARHSLERARDPIHALPGGGPEQLARVIGGSSSCTCCPTSSPPTSSC